VTVIGAEAYPLQWPDGWPRTPSHRRESDNRFGISGGFTEEGRRVGRRITVGRARQEGQGNGCTGVGCITRISRNS
jgi:hypothetical protein